MPNSGTSSWCPRWTSTSTGRSPKSSGHGLQIKAQSEPRLTDEQRAYLRQLDADVWHSSLLHRMLFERKLPLREPPSLRNAYPDYDAESTR
jgi:hypothetical protein